MVEEKYKMKMAAISGASHALEFKKRNPGASDDEILKRVTERSDEIIEKIDDGGEF